MKKSSRVCFAVIAIFCLNLICLKPGQALDTRFPSNPAIQDEHSRRGTESRSGLAGHWTLQSTGDTVDIDGSNGRMIAIINGVEWELAESGDGLTATRVLSREEARRLFPDIADAPAALSGKSVTLALAPRGGDSFDMSLSMPALGTGRRGRRAVALMSGSLTKLPVHRGPDGDSAERARADVVPQTVGTLTMSVFPSPAPNAFGSPSFAGYTANAISALGSGLSSVGNPATTPTAYFRVSSLDDRGNIVTGFPSWKGLISPATNFGAAFSSELGNRLHYGLHIVGNGTQFKLSNLQFHMHGSDAGDIFAFDGDFSGLSYSSTRVGLNYGADHTKGTMDDILITSGPTTQLVDELMYVGVGNSLAPDDASCPGTNQATLDCIKATYDSKIPFSITTTYNLFDDSAHLLGTTSATVDFGNCITLSACPANIVAKVPFGQMSGAINYANPTASSSCGESVQVVCVPPSGAQFQVGVTTVTCTATDAALNTASCSFTVTLWDVVLQDNVTGDVLLINSKNGNYSYTRCGAGGFTLTGTGTIQNINGILMLSHMTPTRRVMASFLTGQLTGKATIVLMPAPGVFQTLTINSTNPNPSLTCPH